ncbi:MAG: helix-turn-helix transcriptional regulator [Candidatus Poribacteria bacterium]|nr:helix-turn-helix transcriptional regulator [Candidatus Poribacteria bacterium]
MKDRSPQSAEYISEKIKKLREECDWSQSDLAKKAGITASAISMIERGQRVPSLVVIRKISDALKVSVSELTGETTQEEVTQHAQAFFRQFGDLNELSEDEQKIILDLARSLKDRSNAKGDS